MKHLFTNAVRTFVLLACLATAYGFQLQPMGAYLNGAFPPTSPANDSSLPAKLSQTGAFANLSTLSPTAGLIPYSVNSPLWSDNAVKSRWIALPNDGNNAEEIDFSNTESWNFPAGTVIVKHFELPLDANNAASTRRLETRFLVIVPGDFYAVTYKWNAAGTEATLLPDGDSETYMVTDADGSTRAQTWSFPSRADCRSCHNQSIGVVNGIRTHQLNGDFLYPGEASPQNQLAAWSAAGLFDQTLTAANIASYLKSVAITDSTADLETRVRSYLDSNCAICHHPGSGLQTNFDYRFTTPLANQNLINGTLLYDLGVDHARVIAPGSLERSILHYRMSTNEVAHRMPPIGRNEIDQNAVDVVSAWILSLNEVGNGGQNSSPLAANDNATTIQNTAVTISALGNDQDSDGDNISLSTFSQPAHGTITWNGPSVTYVPSNGFIGADSFTYSVEDSNGSISNTATVSITVNPAATANSATYQDRSNRLANSSNYSGVAMGVSDMNGDGYDDIVHLNQGRYVRIDYQSPNGTNFTGASHGTLPKKAWGMALGDADNDGYPDIISGGYYDGLDYRRSNSSGTGYSTTNLSSPTVFLQAINFADINGDQHLDIFACHDDARNAKFRNNGSGTMIYDNGLIDTRTNPASDNSGNYGSLWTDYDNDGDLDLYIAKCRQGASSYSDPRRINQLFRNNGNGSFTEVGDSAGLDFGHQSWVADFGDIDNDGDLDCFVGNHNDPSFMMRNNGNGTFTNITANSGIDVEFYVIQSVFRDFNNDGWLDLFITGVGDHHLWLNDRDGSFTKTANPFSIDIIQSCAIGDLNHDGFPDVYAGYANGYNTPRSSKPDKMFHSVSNGNRFLSVSLTGEQSNRLGSGARLELTGPWGTQTREVRTGEGYGITHSSTQTFGMANASAANSLTINWPSGTVDSANNVAANQFLNIREGETQTPSLSNPGNQDSEPNASIQLALNASDPTNDTLTFSAINLPVGLAINSSTGVISGTTPATGGSYSVQVSVSDAWSSRTRSFRWDIRPPLIVLSPGNRESTAGDTVAFGTQAETSDNIAFTASGLPNGISINANTGLISGTLSSNAAGTYNVTITGTRGSSTDSTVFQWLVNPGLSIAIQNIALATNGNEIEVTYTNAGQISLTDGWMLFFDTDQNISTGYQVFGKGADYLLRNDRVFAYTGSGSNWSWEHIGDAGTDISGSTATLSFPATWLGTSSGLQSVFFGDNSFYEGGSGASLYPPDANGGGSIDLALNGNQNDSIVVDGDISDWPDSYFIGFDIDDVEGPNNLIDLRELYMYEENENLYLFVTNDTPITLNDGWMFFFDTDKNANTGYQAWSIGGDYMLRGQSVYQYTGTGGNWSWSLIGNAQAAVQNQWVEFSLPKSWLGGVHGFEFIFYGSNAFYDGGSGIDVFPETGSGAVYEPNLGDGARTIDGDLSDWNASDLFISDGLDIPAGNSIDIIDVYATHNDNQFYVGILNENPIGIDDSWITWIDTDQNNSTGFRAWNAGADYMVQGDEVYQYSGTGSNWSWSYIGRSTAGANGTSFEYCFPRSWIGNPTKMNLLFYGNNSASGGSTNEILPNGGGNGKEYTF